MALVCLTSLPLLMLIMGEFQFERLHAVLACAACDSGQCMCVCVCVGLLSVRTKMG